MRTWMVIGLVTASCGGTRAEPSGPCAADSSFAGAVPIAEASGAVYWSGDGDEAPRVLVVGDSGTRGELAEIDARTGAVLADTRLPLDERASDDLEGLSTAGGVVYAITSSGWMRHYHRAGAGDYTLEVEAYPLAPMDSEMVCAGLLGNCGKNYEGLCMVADPASAAPNACVGFAASKTDGRLYCLTASEGGRLQLDAARSIRVTRVPEALTGCDLSPDDDTLWVGANAFAARRVSVVRGWRDPGSARVELVGSLGEGFPEALAVGPSRVVYRFSDTSGRPSAMSRHRCR